MYPQRKLCFFCSFSSSKVDLLQVHLYLLARGVSLFWPRSGRPRATKSREVPHHMKSDEGLFLKSTSKESGTFLPVEFEILCFGFRNTAQGFRIPLTIVPMTKKREFGTWNQESGIHGDESRDCLGLPYMGRFSGIYLETRWF